MFFILTCSENMFRLCNALFRISINTSVKLLVAMVIQFDSDKLNVINLTFAGRKSIFVVHLVTSREQAPTFIFDMVKTGKPKCWTSTMFETELLTWLTTKQNVSGNCQYEHSTRKPAFSKLQTAGIFKFFMSTSHEMRGSGEDHSERGGGSTRK